MGKDLVIGPNDTIVVKATYKFPVPTNIELKLLLDLWEDYTPIKAALGILAIQSLRGAELCGKYGHVWKGLEWDDEKKQILTHRYMARKATRIVCIKGQRHYFKELKKPWFSPWLTKQVIIVWLSSHSNSYNLVRPDSGF